MPNLTIVEEEAPITAVTQANTARDIEMGLESVSQDSPIETISMKMGDHVFVNDGETAVSINFFPVVKRQAQSLDDFYQLSRYTTIMAPGFDEIARAYVESFAMRPGVYEGLLALAKGE